MVVRLLLDNKFEMILELYNLINKFVIIMATLELSMNSTCKICVVLY